MASEREVEFNAAVDYIKRCTAEQRALIGKDDLDRLYGLRQQSTIGNCNTPKPWFLGRKKWESWHQLSGLSKREAMTQYIDLTSTCRTRIAQGRGSR